MKTMYIYIKKFLLLALTMLFIVKVVTITTIINKSSCTPIEEMQYFANNYADDGASILLFETKKVEDSTIEPYIFLFSILKYILLLILGFILTTFRNIFLEDHRIKLAQLIPCYFYGGKFNDILFA
jgi:hypothetical protein